MVFMIFMGAFRQAVLGKWISAQKKHRTLISAIIQENTIPVRCAAAKIEYLRG